MSRAALERTAGCKVNLLLNVLGKRADNFHELETVMQPLELFDLLSFRRAGSGVALTCSNPALPTDAQNLVYRAAESFLQASGIHDGVQIHLEKRIPLAAGLGGGSGNAAVTLLGLNELFSEPLGQEALQSLAASLGSDVPFFLYAQPAVATGRGERIEPVPAFRALKGTAFLLVYPGFGISSAWAYAQLARHPAALQGRPGRARELAALLQTDNLREAGRQFYNSLEAPALEKYPLLALFQDFAREKGAMGTLMSGSGSTTFAVMPDVNAAEALAVSFKTRFGDNYWTAVVPV